jgi:hypothetical protein
MLLKRNLMTLKNNCVTLWDTLSKNLDRIENPRGTSNAIAHMY